MEIEIEKGDVHNRQLEKSLSYLKAINVFSSELLHAKEIEDVVWLIACHVSESFGLEDCVVYLFDEETRLMEKTASYYPTCFEERVLRNPLKIPLGEGIVGSVAESGKSEIITDTRKDKRYIPDEFPRLSELTVPITYEGEVIGAIDSEHPDVNFYSLEHLETLLAIANLSSAKIKNLMLVKKELESRQELIVGEETNKKILGNALDAVVTATADGSITFWNTQAENIFGWKKEEAIGQKFNDLIVPEWLRGQHNMMMQRYLTEGESRQLNKRFEIEVLKRDSSTFPAELTITPVKVRGKLSLNAFIRDITAQKAYQEKLERQYQEIEKINMDLDRFVHGISHDLKGPVVNLQGLVDLLRDKRGDIEKENECYHMIDKSLDQMRTLMEDLLTYSKNSNLELVGENLDLNPLITEIIEEHRFMKYADRVKFSMDIDEQHQLVTDKTRLRIVFSNLISNAIKYQDLNKINSFVRIKSFEKEEELIVTVQDNGIGVAKEDANKIFEMFYRSGQPSSKISGTGIGLYILKETLKKLEGTIEIETAKGKGSTFRVSIPKRL